MPPKSKSTITKILKDIFQSSFVLECDRYHKWERGNSNYLEFSHLNPKANNLDNTEKMATAYCDKVKPYFEVIREHCDKLELLVDNGIWPLTKYRELFFIK